MVTVLVVGDVINDVLVVASEETTRGADTPSSVTWQPGGQGANQAAWLASLGAPVRFAGRVGALDADRHGDLLATAGVDVRLAIDDACQTGTIVVLVEEGERSMFTDRGAGARLGPADLPAELLDGVSLLEVSGYSLFLQPGREAVLSLMEKALRRGIAVSVDAASVTGLRQVGAASFLDWVAPAGMVFVNEDEGGFLSGTPDPHAMLERLLERVAEVALKLGSGGALCGTSSGERVLLPVVPGPLVDTTGAGDAFAAGYLAERLRGGKVEQCALAATRASALAVARIGGRPPLPMRP